MNKIREWLADVATDLPGVVADHPAAAIALAAAGALAVTVLRWLI